MTSLAVIGAGAYSASLVFSVPSSPKAAPAHKHGLRGASAPNSGGLSSAACAAAGAVVAGAVQGNKRANKRGVQARAVEEELEYAVGERVMVLGPPAMAGKQGTVEGPALGNAFMVRFESGSLFNIASENLALTSAAPPPPAAPVAATTSYVAPATVSAPAESGDEEELEYQPGQRVVMLGPPAMAGKQGTVLGPALGGAFSVQFDSGSVFNITTANMQDAAGPAPTSVPLAVPVAAATASAVVSAPAASGDEEELLFQPGERVTIIGPPAMAGKQGTVEGPALGDAFAIRFDSGSVFNIATANLQGSGSPAPAAAPVAAAATSYAAPAAVSAPAESADEELEFQPGQRVVLLGPPAMSGKQGTIMGPALGDSFAVQFDSGSVFNISAANIQDAAGPAPPAPVAAAPVAAPAAVSAPAASGDEELEFQAGQSVVLIGPPAMAGKRGTIVGPALGDSFSVLFESGSVFNISSANIQDAAAPAPAPPAATTSYAAPASAPQAATPSTDEELEFQPGQKVEIVAPPAMAGKRGEIIGPALGSAFAVRFESGSVFNIESGNIRAMSMAMA